MTQIDSALGVLAAAPGPSPWYLRLPQAATVSGFSWRGVGDVEKAGMVLVGPAGPVAIVSMYRWVARLGTAELIIWYQARGEGEPVRFVVVRPADLQPLKGEIVDLCPARGEEPGIVLGSPPVAEFKLDTTIVDQDLSASFPEPVEHLEELLLVCRPVSWHLALLVAHPAASSYRLYPQDWFSPEAGFDLGYQWVTRVARDPSTGKVCGDGIRIGPFVLDHTLRRPERKL